ncbi:MAG TPA: penicillin acylase family protein, partial [Spirochaetia bacterium]|nr:penicillin acylase family protein [Spirochaetia bacterium]
SGKPILANDPHLGIQMPSIWYEVDLYCSAPQAEMGKPAGGPFHVRGFSFPGDPGVIIGHNDRIAWGVTNTNPDVQQLYIEHINPQNPDQYEVNGKWVDMKVQREEITVFKRDDPVIVMARETRHGPIITDQGAYSGYRGFAINPHGELPANLSLSVLSLKWTAFMSNRTFQSAIRLDEARNFQEFRDALRSWDIPSQNFVYADVDGNIGYQMPGLIPIRKNGDGSLPSPGWVDDYEWTGFIPFDDLPYSYNPPKGYIASANNPVTTPSYRYFISHDYDYGYRARRIIAMITGNPAKMTINDVEAMQGDTLNILAQEIVPYLKGLSLSSAAQRAREILLGWNNRMGAGSAGAAVYGYFWQSLLENAFRNKFPGSLWTPEGLLDDNSRQMNAISVMLKDPHHPLWDDPTTPGTRESRDDILTLSLEKAVRMGTKAQGPDLAKWRWGRAHIATFRNLTFGESGIPIIERIFNRGPFPVPAGFQQVFCTDWKASKPFDVSAVSSMRQVIDLSDLSKSVTIHTTGQSGHPGNRHYDDMIGSWSHVTYHPTLWDLTALEASRPDRLVLRPR